MASGNPMGLSEISHFGQFKGVGGKAGGFISKKFFHPSSFRNQEKLWKAQSEDARETKKQQELEKRREEERQVEDLRKQMYLAGQGSKGDFLTTAAEEKAASSHLSVDERTEQRQAIEEQKKRKAMVRHQAREAERAAQAREDDGEDGEEADADAAPASGKTTFRAADGRPLAKSKYKEDDHVLGHNTVWGSWYSAVEKQWGFKCCKTQAKSEACPLAEEPAEGAAPGKRRRRGGIDGGDASPLGGDAAASPDTTPAEIGGLLRVAPVSALSSGGLSRGSGSASLMESRLANEAARRQKVKSPELTPQATTSGYLADLLLDPSAASPD
mmetsp:Transcript_48993/g.88098  ORF Transcript_48993/g.88098 Transcript_48993/m.88098 type:complete len:328 (+) Transcript_48993:84-1067(+)